MSQDLVEGNLTEVDSVTLQGELQNLGLNRFTAEAATNFRYLEVEEWLKTEAGQREYPRCPPP